MAANPTKISNQTGNFTSSSVWSSCDATSLLDSIAGTTALTTSFQTSATFTPGAITIDGIAVYVATRAVGSPSNTITVQLAQGGTLVTGTAVTMNVADIDPTSSEGGNIGWYFFKFSSSVTLSAATAYTVQAKLSATTTAVSLYTNGTAANFSRLLRTTTTAAPIAGDSLICIGDNTGTGAHDAFTITMDNTAALDLGALSATASIMVGKGGTWTNGTTALTAYKIEWVGLFVVCSGGTLNIGTSGTPMPSTSSATYTMDSSSSNVASGLDIRGGATFNTQGATVTNVMALLAADTSTSPLTTNISTGWLSGDIIAAGFESTITNTALSSNASGTSVPIAGTFFSFTIYGTSPTQFPVGHFSRNVIITGSTPATAQGYILFKTTSTVNCQYTMFCALGSSTLNKRGIDCTTTTGSCSVTYCSIGPGTTSGLQGGAVSGLGFNVTGASSNNITFSNNVTQTQNNGFAIAATSGTNWTCNGNLFLGSCDASSDCVTLGDLGGTFSNNIMFGPTRAGVSLTEIGGIIGTFAGNTCIGAGGSGSTSSLNGLRIGGQIGGSTQGVISTQTCWNMLTSGIEIASPCSNLQFNTATLFGNSGGNIQFDANGIGVNFDSITGDSRRGSTSSPTSNTNIAITTDGACWIGTVTNSLFGTNSGVTTSDIAVSSSAINATMLATFKNCEFSSTTEMSGQAFMTNGSFVGSQKDDQTTGKHQAWSRFGNLNMNTGTVHTGSQSMQLIPNNASNKLKSPSFFAAVASGATVTPAVYINKQSTYTGNQPRLMQARNDALGVTSDTVIATYSSGTGSWNSISGTTGAATDDGVFEFYVDCDGTAGSIFVDSFTVT